MARSFEDKPAVLERVPLWIGLFGASGSGKSLSSLRLATGMQRVAGGDIYAIDTESRRLLHYAEHFKFRHLDFRPPFGPADYTAAVQHCVDRKAGVVIIDSASHEWEGAGGVLEMHAAELERRSGGDHAKAERANMAAWIKPKSEHRKMIAALLQLDVSIIFCFRAREKIKPVKGGNPIELGFQPIAPDDITFEMMLNCMLPPGSDGVPAWRSEFQGERALMKLPQQFRELFAKDPPPQLTEGLGEQLARWAAGGAAPARPAAPKPEPQSEPDPGLLDFVNAYADVATWEELSKLESQRKQIWEKLNGRDKKTLKDASDAASKRIGKEAAR